MSTIERIRDGARDPYTASIAVLAVVALAGLVAIALAAAGIAGVDALDEQMPYVASGGLGGLALVVVAAAVHATQRARLAAARRREGLDRVLRAATAVLAEVRER